MIAKELILYSLLLISGSFLLYKGFVAFRTRKLIENTPTSKIRSLAMGFVEVYGLIVPFRKNILHGPFSQKDCVYYKFTIERYENDDKGGGWKTVREGSEGVPFMLKDATGSVLVDSTGAEVDAPLTKSIESLSDVNPPKHVQAFLKKKNFSFASFLAGNCEMRYREYALFPSQKVYIMGTADDNPHVAEGKMQKNEEDIMIQKGNEVFYISFKEEKDVLRSFMWKIFRGISIGTLLFFGGLIGIFLYWDIL